MINHFIGWMVAHPPLLALLGCSLILLGGCAGAVLAHLYMKWAEWYLK